MKNRNGFVSNSSSSSFIVRLYHKPKDINDLKDMMFPKYDMNEEIERYNYKLSVRDIVSRVFIDINNKKVKMEDIIGSHIESLNNSISSHNWDYIKELYDELWSLHIDDDKEYKEYKEYKALKKKIDLLEKRYLIQRKKDIKELLYNWRNLYKYHKFEFFVEYGDRHGDIVLEHGSIFRNVPNIVFSNH